MLRARASFATVSRTWSGRLALRLYTSLRRDGGPCWIFVVHRIIEARSVPIPFVFIISSSDVVFGPPLVFPVPHKTSGECNNRKEGANCEQGGETPSSPEIPPFSVAPVTAIKRHGADVTLLG